jgi:hypothetical protein
MRFPVKQALHKKSFFCTRGNAGRRVVVVGEVWCMYEGEEELYDIITFSHIEPND